MGILNQKNLWPTLIYQFEHLGHPKLNMCIKRTAVYHQNCKKELFQTISKLKVVYQPNVSVVQKKNSKFKIPKSAKLVKFLLKSCESPILRTKREMVLDCAHGIRNPWSICCYGVGFTMQSNSLKSRISIIKRKRQS